MGKITIVFKGGAKESFECENFIVKESRFGELVGVEWQNAKGKRPRQLVVSEIAGIFEEIEEETK